MSTPQAIRGTQDIFGAEAEAFAHVVETFERVRKLYRFRRIEMPVFEKTEVFSRSIGETTDVVSKEMYSFPDRGGENLTLRPEFTAGICRAYLTNGWQQHAPVRLATHGPLFRYERPQKGRYRQFHQLDAEIIGDDEPRADVDLLVMADQLLKELKISGVTLQLNTLGDADSRSRWQNSLFKYFDAHRDSLSDDSRRRLISNPLRILDSKDSVDREIVADAPVIDGFLSPEAGRFFDEVLAGLDLAGISPRINKRLVRGLDYYRHTAFEFVPDENSEAAYKLGSQSTVLGGGRYDGLMESLGGTPTPAVGWAAGIERLAMLVETPPELKTAMLVVESEQPALLNLGDIMLRAMRRKGMPSGIVNSGPIRKRYDRAMKTKPDYVVVLRDSDDLNCVADLAVKRHLRLGGRKRVGRLYVSLKLLLKNQFGIDPDVWKQVVNLGGSISLAPKTR